LRKKYAEENTPESLAKLNRLEEAIAYFITLEPSADWPNRLNEAKKLLNEI
jgi:lambda repressor-like predicted transcriptional regulator